MRLKVESGTVVVFLLLALWSGAGLAQPADVPEQPLQDWEEQAITLARPSDA